MQIYPEYFQFIKHPTDLKTIAGKIKDRVMRLYPSYLANPADCPGACLQLFSSREDFLTEVRTMLGNCRTFNAPGSDYHSMADRMETFLKYGAG